MREEQPGQTEVVLYDTIDQNVQGTNLVASDARAPKMHFCCNLGAFALLILRIRSRYFTNMSKFDTIYLKIIRKGVDDYAACYPSR